MPRKPRENDFIESMKYMDVERTCSLAEQTSLVHKDFINVLSDTVNQIKQEYGVLKQNL